MKNSAIPEPQRYTPGLPGRQGKFSLWGKRVLIGLALLVGVLALAGFIYQGVASAVDARRYPPPGMLVDLGDRRMHLYCLGEAEEEVPTVILEAHSEGTSSQWTWVQDELAKYSRVCSYDRAGVGWSDPGPDPRDANQVAGELHELLSRAGEAGPYVLVGHSLGGLYVRQFASRYPLEVAGVVLLDAAHPDQFQRSPEFKAGLDFSRRMNRIAALAAPFGLMRLYFGGEQLTPGLPERQSEEVRALWAGAKFWKSRVQEGKARSQTNAQVRASGDLGSLPLMVITAGEGSSQAWLEMQDELAALSTSSVQHVLDGATHLSLIWDQSTARQVSQWILEVVQAAQSGIPLVEE